MRGILVTLYDANSRHRPVEHEPRALRKLREVVKLTVEEVRGPHFGERPQDGLDPPGMTFFPVGEHLADDPPLEVLLRAAEVARDDGEALPPRRRAAG